MKAKGRIAYEAYAAASKGRSLVSGAVLPPAEEISTEMQAAWQAAAVAVIEAHEAEMAAQKPAQSIPPAAGNPPAAAKPVAPEAPVAEKPPAEPTK